MTSSKEDNTGKINI